MPSSPDRPPRIADSLDLLAGISHPENFPEFPVILPVVSSLSVAILSFFIRITACRTRWNPDGSHNLAGVSRTTLISDGVKKAGQFENWQVNLVGAAKFTACQMKPVHELYTQEVYHELRPYHANWTPNQPVSLGDFGLLDQQRFVHQGSLSQFEVNFGVLKKGGTSQQHFCSKGAVEYSAAAKAGSIGSGSPVNARLNVRFTKSGAVFFNLAGCEYHAIDDKIKLGRSIETLYRDGQWQLNWVVVTDVVTARSTTVAVSNSAEAALTLAVDSAVTNIDLANASMELKVESSKGVGYQLVSAPGLSPLFAFARLRTRWLKDPEFGPATRHFTQDVNEDETEFWLEDIV